MLESEHQFSCVDDKHFTISAISPVPEYNTSKDGYLCALREQRWLGCPGYLTEEEEGKGVGRRGD